LDTVKWRSLNFSAASVFFISDLLGSASVRSSQRSRLVEVRSVKQPVQPHDHSKCNPQVNNVKKLSIYQGASPATADIALCSE
jgi:hypothetical protein